MQRSELPDWYPSSPFILTEYRAPTSLAKAAWSIFEWHTETLNIHTHLWAGLYFLYLWFTQPPYADTLSLYLCLMFQHIGPICMTLGSAFGHTFYCIDARWNTFAWKVDFSGIIVVNLTHHLLDTYILAKRLGIEPLPLLIIDMCFAAYCIRDIWAGRKFWLIWYTLITCIPLTATNYFLCTECDAPWYSLLCSLYIGAAAIFFFGQVPERFWPSTVTGHTIHHLLILGSVFAGTAGGNLLIKSE